MSRTTSCLFAAIVLVVSVPHAAPQDKPAPKPADATSASVAWRKDVEIAGTPMLAIGSAALFLGSAKSGLTAYSIPDGKILWESQAMTDVAPIVSGTSVAVLSGRTLEALSQATGQSVWQISRNGAEAPTR